MFEKDMKVAYLLDFYSEALDSHTAAVMKSYYNDDLSLAEIASGVGISRQGIRHLIKKGEEQLFFLEERLSLAKKHSELTEGIERLEALSAKLSARGLDSESRELLSVIEILAKGS